MMFAGPLLTGASARRERGRREMRSAILAAAGTIVDAHGIDGLTVRAVAQAVGYSAGALYEYFDSKEAILAALYFESTDGLGTACEQAVAALPEGANAVDTLVALGHAYRAHALEHAELYRLAFGGFKAPPDPDAVDSPDDPLGGFRTVLRVATQGIAEGSMVDLPPFAIACSAWSAVHGFVSLELTGHISGGDGPGMSPASPEEGRLRRDHMFNAVVRMVIVGFATEEARARMISS